MRKRRSSADLVGGEETIIVIAARVFGLFIGLASQSLLAWLLNAEGRGGFAVVFTFGTLFGLVFTLGTDRAAQYFVIAKRLSLSQGVSVTAMIVAVGSMVATGVGIVMINSGLNYFQQADPASFYIAMLLIPLSLLSASLQLQLDGLRRFAQGALFGFGQSISTLLGLWLFLAVFDLGAKGALIAYLIGYLVGLILCANDLRTHCDLRLAFPSVNDIKLVLGYGVRYYVARLGHAVDLRVAVILLGMYATRDEIGIFAATSGVVLYVLILSDSLEAAMMPRVASDAAGRPDLVGQCARISALFTGVALVGLLAVSEPLVRIVLSPAFLPGVTVIWILAPGVFVHSASKALMVYFRGTNRPGVCSVVIWVGLLCNAFAFVLLYPRLGLAGAAWAMTFGFLARSCVLLFTYQRVAGSSVMNIWRVGRQDFELFKRLFWQLQRRAEALWRGRRGG